MSICNSFFSLSGSGYQLDILGFSMAYYHMSFSFCCHAEVAYISHESFVQFVLCCFSCKFCIFQEGNENTHPTALVRREVQAGLKEWLDYQDGQKILLTTPTVLVGYRLEVYRAEGTTQWYTAVIQSYNHTSKVSFVLRVYCMSDDVVLKFSK